MHQVRVDPTLLRYEEKQNDQETQVTCHFSQDTKGPNINIGNNGTLLTKIKQDGNECVYTSMDFNPRKYRNKRIRFEVEIKNTQTGSIQLGLINNSKHLDKSFNTNYYHGNMYFAIDGHRCQRVSHRTNHELSSQWYYRNSHIMNESRQFKINDIVIFDVDFRLRRIFIFKKSGTTNVSGNGSDSNNVNIINNEYVNTTQLHGILFDDILTGGEMDENYQFVVSLHDKDDSVELLKCVIVDQSCHTLLKTVEEEVCVSNLLAMQRDKINGLEETVGRYMNEKREWDDRRIKWNQTLDELKVECEDWQQACSQLQQEKFSFSFCFSIENLFEFLH